MRINLKLDLSHLPEGHTGHLMPTEEVVNTFLDISKKSKIKNILEFGFNTGWSSYIMLELFKKAKITSIEIYKFSEALKGVSIIKNTFHFICFIFGITFIVSLFTQRKLKILLNNINITISKQSDKFLYSYI